jgi:hypothetical protein
MSHAGVEYAVAILYECKLCLMLAKTAVLDVGRLSPGRESRCRYRCNLGTPEVVALDYRTVFLNTKIKQRPFGAIVRV